MPNHLPQNNAALISLYALYSHGAQLICSRQNGQARVKGLQHDYSCLLSQQKHHRILPFYYQQFQSMSITKQKQSKPNAYLHVSLPKDFSHTDKKLGSMRCISVSKPEPKCMTAFNGQPSKTQPKQLSYYLGKGNNEGLIRRIMKCRPTWAESDDSTSAFINLKWQQDQKGFKYDRLIDSGLYRGVVNQFEFHEVLTNKQLLFKNLEHYCQKNGLDLWKIVPPTYLLNTHDECSMQMLKRFTDAYEKYYPKRLKEKSGGQSEAEVQEAKAKLKRVFFNSNLKKIMPKSPPIKTPFLDQEADYLWIVKPTFLNRGRGIQVFSRLQALYKFVSDNIGGYVQKSLVGKEEEEGHHKAVDYIKRNSEQIRQSVMMRDPANREFREKREQSFFDGNQYIRVIPRGPAIIKTDRFLVQKYLEKPMLIMNRKFDIRIWVLATSSLKGFVFQEGYVRLSSLEYSCTDSPANNTFMHLTNNAVQKFSEGYGSVADGNQLSFKHLSEQMSKLGLNFEQCLRTIHSHIRVSLKAGMKLLNPMNRKFSFQVYGYDFMIDENGYPWLIEVNTNPCIEESSKLLEMLLPRMIDDAFRLTLDPLFYGSVSNANFKVSGYPDNANMWLNLNIEDK